MGILNQFMKERSHSKSKNCDDFFSERGNLKEHIDAVLKGEEALQM